MSISASVIGVENVHVPVLMMMQPSLTRGDRDELWLRIVRISHLQSRCSQNAAIAA